MKRKGKYLKDLRRNLKRNPNFGDSDRRNAESDNAVGAVLPAIASPSANAGTVPEGIPRIYYARNR